MKKQDPVAFSCNQTLSPIPFVVAGATFQIAEFLSTHPTFKLRIKLRCHAITKYKASSNEANIQKQILDHLAELLFGQIWKGEMLAANIFKIILPPFHLFCRVEICCHICCHTCCLLSDLLWDLLSAAGFAVRLFLDNGGFLACFGAFSSYPLGQNQHFLWKIQVNCQKRIKFKWNLLETVVGKFL